MPVTSPQGTLDFKKVDKITFVGASSNTVIDTTTGSVGIGVVGDALSSNLHVVGDTRMEGNINMLHTSNTASIKLNSNVVTEFPRSKKLIKYPRVALTQNDESATSGYVVEQTNTASHGNADAYAYRLFDNTSGAYQSGSAYSGGIPTSSAPTTTASDESTHQGVAITLDLVTKIRLDHAVFTSHANYGRTPVDGSFLGSNDSSTWDVIGTFAGLSTSADNQKHTITITGSSQKLAYRYIRFVVTKTHDSSVFNGNSLLEFRELEYYGVPEYDPEAHGTDVVVKSEANVPNTDWLEVYYEGKNYTNGNIVQDETANNRDGTLNGAGFDTEYKAFTFDGLNDYIRRDGIPTPTGSGNFVHTVSMWFKLDSLPAVATSYFLWGLTGENDGTDGNPSSNSTPHATVGANGIISWAIWGNDIANQTAIVANRWYHCVWTYSGGTNGRKMFLDGIEQTFNTAQTTALNTVNSTARLTIGIYPTNLSSSPLKGSVANFRLFNRALTSDEIYQLYAYQKEYFGHGDLSMTLKAGRLGIGTLEPRAMLDVRGEASFRSKIYGPLSTFETVNFTSIYSTVWTSSQGADETELTLLTATVQVPDIYKHLGQHNLQIYYTWHWTGEAGRHNPGTTLDTDGGAFYFFHFRTRATHNSVVRNMHSGNVSSIVKIVSPIAVSLPSNDHSTLDQSVIPGIFTLDNATAGDDITIELTGVWTSDVYGEVRTNRTMADANSSSYERGVTTLCVWFKPII